MRTFLKQLFRVFLVCLSVTQIAVCQSESGTTEQYHLICRLVAQRDYVQAVVESQHLIERMPEHEHVYAKLVNAASAAKQLDQVKGWLEALTRRTPPVPGAYYGLALIENEKKEYAAAIEHYEHCLRELPDFDLAIQRLVDVWVSSGKKVEAEIWLKSLIDSRSDRPTAHFGLGYLYLREGKTDAAAKELETAIGFGPSTTDACSYLISTWLGARRVGRAMEVIQRYQLILEQDPDEERRKDNLALIGSIHLRLGQYQAAISYLQRAIKLARELSDRIAEAGCLGLIGDAYLRQDNYAQALSNYEQAVEIGKEIKLGFNSGRIWGNIGDVYFALGDLETAQTRYEQAIELAKEEGDENNQSSLLMSIGELLVIQNKPAQAIVKYEQGMVIARRRSNPALLSTGLNALGVLYLKAGDFQNALDSLQHALKLAHEMSSPILEGTTLNNLGKLHLHHDEPALAIQDFKSALQIAANKNNLQNVWIARTGLGRANEKLGKLDVARDHYQKAIEVMEGVRAQIDSEEQKSGFLASKIEVYQELVALLMKLDRADPAKSNASEAFHYTERARARAFLDLLAEAKVDPEQNAAPDLLKRQQELQQRISQLTAQLINERSQETSKQDTGRIGELKKGLSQADSEVGDWLRELRRRNPRYAALKYPVPVTLADTQRMLDDKTILLSYSLAEPVSFLFAITRDDFQVKRLPSEAMLREGVQKLLAAITDKNKPSPDAYRRQAARLTQELLRPISRMLAGKTALVIVPDGALHRLPFEVLLLPEKPALGDLRRLPYLIRDFSISYAPSASVLAGLQNEPRETASKGFIAFGDPIYQQQRAEGAIASTLRAAGAGRLNFQRLSHSREEVEGIARLFSKDDRELFLGEAATEENVKATDRLSRYRIVHFSTHGYVNETRPRFSGLVLSLPSNNSPTAAAPQSTINRQSEDGLLSAYEIFNLKLRADLVVLSACETGLGKEVKGEGLMSLMRAFMYAGTPSVVVSLWNVNDESAADLMIRFYRHLKTGRVSKAEALRQAQLEMIGDNGFPFFWAPFVLVGKP